MIIGCKVGSLCSDINKDYCCRECDDYKVCENVCEKTQSLLSRSEIYKSCDEAILINA